MRATIAQKNMATEGIMGRKFWRNIYSWRRGGGGQNNKK